MSSSQHLPLDSLSDELPPQQHPLLSSLWRPIIGLIALSVIYHAYIILYRLALHPLAKVPGPKLHAASWFPFLWQANIAASAPRTIEAMHRKYGPVVRVGPDQVALDGSLGWSAVFAHTTGSKPEFGKAFEQYFPGDANSLIGAPRDRHRRMRRQLAHAFSAGALAEQEGTVTQYVDLLLDRLRTLEGDEFDIIPWLNFTTFDIIGDLAFSDSFGSLDGSAYHPWVLSFFQGIRGSALRRFFRHYPGLGFIAARLGLTGDFKVEEHNRHTARDNSAARMRLGVDGPAGKTDFMTHMLRKTRTGETALNEEEILSTSPVLVIAGSETTATALAGFLFFLAQNPEKRELVVSEIMEAFPEEEGIDMRSTARLEYLRAALEETLRLYPPVTVTPPRVSPGAEVGGYYIPKDVNPNFGAPVGDVPQPGNFHLPEQFLPERWLPASHPRYEARFANDSRAVFKPFSHGPRDCIGKNLAYAEMRLLAARMLRTFEVTIEGQSEWQSKQRMFGLWEKIPLN
ncbi:hypothetical protein MY1884_009604, partial [Beauveria asiatica]